MNATGAVKPNQAAKEALPWLARFGAAVFFAVAVVFGTVATPLGRGVAAMDR